MTHARRDLSTKPAIHNMPCCKVRKNSVDFWNITSTGDYGLDCAQGRELARRYLAEVAPNEDRRAPMGLNFIVSGMARKGEIYGRGIRIGFMTEIDRFIVAAVAGRTR